MCFTIIGCWIHWHYWYKTNNYLYKKGHCNIVFVFFAEWHSFLYFPWLFNLSTLSHIKTRPLVCGKRKLYSNWERKEKRKRMKYLTRKSLFAWQYSGDGYVRLQQASSLLAPFAAKALRVFAPAIFCSCLFLPSPQSNGWTETPFASSGSLIGFLELANKV